MRHAIWAVTLAMGLAGQSMARAEDRNMPGTYEVPVPQALAADAVHDLLIRVRRGEDDTLRLNYTLPLAITGGRVNHVALRGQRDQAGYDLHGDTVSKATCVEEGDDLVCHCEYVKRTLSFGRPDEGLAGIAPERRLAAMSVAAFFMHEPRGILRIRGGAQR